VGQTVFVELLLLANRKNGRRQKTRRRYGQSGFGNHSALAVFVMRPQAEHQIGAVEIVIRTTRFVKLPTAPDPGATDAAGVFLRSCRAC
jgi:hypothetical protein